MAPEQKPGKSKQDYSTPIELIDAITNLLGIGYFDWDLAADSTNKVAPHYYDEDSNALADHNTWNFKDWAWCNPPYSNIEPWVKKAHFESMKGAKIAMLIPASPGSNWWRDWVDRKALVLFLNGRITFKGMTAPYPKDSALLLYGIQPKVNGYKIWDWRKGEII